ncbi:hypothetical protein RJT34_32341 [Clitoria ternatea]|uniref:Uncharacterized protein n=1 Tax=Clitoria ternatea TaxID=43366 RepID=A0AAN9I9C7_CLITE
MPSAILSLMSFIFYDGIRGLKSNDLEEADVATPFSTTAAHCHLSSPFFSSFLFNHHLSKKTRKTGEEFRSTQNWCLQI